jgi:uncharacterized SAM-binding protein YcdF (DUF218 family)
MSLLRVLRARVPALLALFVALLLVLLHPLWLTALGSFLVVREPLRQADAIVVLGGGGADRAAHATQLYQQGWAPVLVLSNEQIRTHGLVTTWEALWRRGLVVLPVPAEAVVPLPPHAKSTHDEALLSRDLMLARGWRRAILVTDPYHLRRSLLVFRAAWDPSGLEVIPNPAEPSDFDLSNWWRDPDQALLVQLEYQKLLYYLLAGRL